MPEHYCRLTSNPIAELKHVPLNSLAIQFPDSRKCWKLPHVGTVSNELLVRSHKRNRGVPLQDANAYFEAIGGEHIILNQELQVLASRKDRQQIYVLDATQVAL